MIFIARADKAEVTRMPDNSLPEPNPTADITTFPANRRAPVYSTRGLMRPETITTANGKVFIDPEDKLIRLDTRNDIRQEIKLGNVMGQTGTLTKIKTVIDRKRRQLTTYYLDRDSLRWIIITSPLPEGKEIPEGMNPVGFNANQVQTFKASRRGPDKPPITADVQLIQRPASRGLIPWLGLASASSTLANLTEGSSFVEPLTEREQITGCPHNAGGLDPTGLCGFGGNSQRHRLGSANPRNRSARGVRLTINT